MKSLSRLEFWLLEAFCDAVPSFFSSLHWEPLSWLEFLRLISILKLCPTLSTPGLSLAVMLPSPSWVSFWRLRNSLEPTQVSFRFCPFLRSCSPSCAHSWYAVPHFAACPFPPQLCQAKGFICEFCQNEDDIIFPFELHKCRTCEGECWCHIWRGQIRLNTYFLQPPLLARVWLGSETPCVSPGAVAATYFQLEII